MVLEKNILLIGYELLGLKEVKEISKDNSTKQNPELKLLQFGDVKNMAAD